MRSRRGGSRMAGAELAAVLVDPGGVLAGGGSHAVDDEAVDDEGRG
jgi:hypothetical protein